MVWASTRPFRERRRRDAFAAAEPLHEGANGAADLFDLGLVEGGERRAEEILALRASASRRASVDCHEAANVLGRALDLALQRGDERVGARLTERVDETNAQAGQLVLGAPRADVLEEPMRVEPACNALCMLSSICALPASCSSRLSSAPRCTSGPSALSGEAAANASSSSRTMSSSASLKPSAARRSHSVRRGSRAKYRVERVVEARAITRALDDHGRDGVANDVARLEADGAHRAHRIDGLRRGDGKAGPPKHPEELVGHTESRAHVRHRERAYRAGGRGAAGVGGGIGAGGGAVSARSVFSEASRRARRSGRSR